MEKIIKVIWTAYGNVAIDLEYIIPNLEKAIRHAGEIEIEAGDSKGAENVDNMLRALTEFKDIMENWKAYCSKQNRERITED